MTTNIVEAVARAISRHTYAMVTGHDDCGDFDEMSPEAQAVYRKAAREVLSASPLAEMREALREIDRHVSHAKLGDWSIALDEIRKIARAALAKFGDVTT